MGRIKIFHKPHKLRQREHQLCSLLVSSWDADLIEQDFRLDEEQLCRPVDSLKLIHSLERDSVLPAHRREKLIGELRRLPTQLKAAQLVTQVSVDLTAEIDNERYFWEFHEEQHCNLKDDRAKKIYDMVGNVHSISRGLQRLLRDIWRIQCLPNLTIVWHDWFLMNQSSFIPVNARGFREYCLPDKFSFTSFCTGASSSQENRQLAIGN
jgi:hypothetical protein